MSFLIMCTRPVSVRLPPNPYEISQGFIGDKVIKVPCGKCPECLGKRQKDISLRCYRAALKYSNCRFLTLTYKPSKVPIAETVLATDMITGEQIIHKCAERCSTEILPEILDKYHKSKGLFVEFRDLVDFEDIHYQVVYTPTLDYTDVRLLIKDFRVRWEREYHEKLNFQYMCVGEYGSKPYGSHRPHYHILLFGLSELQAMYLQNMWQDSDERDLGYAYLETVLFKNGDGSDGLARVSSYIGKYAAKGSFNPSTVLSRYTIRSRVCASKHLGFDNMDSLYSHYRGYDIAGVFDIEKCDHNQNKDWFYDILLNRLKYLPNGKSCPLPTSFRKKIFGYKSVGGKNCYSRLYYEVMDFARAKFEAICDREFREFCASHLDWSLSETVLAFNSLRESSLQIRERSEKERMRSFYSKSKF